MQRPRRGEPGFNDNDIIPTWLFWAMGFALAVMVTLAAIDVIPQHDALDSPARNEGTTHAPHE